MRISVLVPTFDKRPFLAAALGALSRQRLARDLFEVVVVVDGSTDGTAEMLAGLKTPYALRYVTRPNGGLASARNCAAAAARGTHLLFMDDDIVLSPPHLEALYASLETSPDAVHVGDLRNVGVQHVPGLLPRLTGASRDEDLDLDPYCVESRIYEALKVLFGAAAGSEAPLEPAVWWAVVTGGNLCVPRTAFESVGGFDEQFRGWGPEDADLCYRLFQRGVGATFDGACRVYHLDHARDSEKVARALCENAFHLYKKHGRPPELLAYLRYFNGLTSLEEFNNDCARRFAMPSLSLAPFMASLREVLSRDQVVRWQ